jgi:hypothetical protein
MSDNEEVEQLLANMGTALDAISKQVGNGGKIECPVCKGDLYWRRARINGHVWGKCKTENCLSWMQ